MGEEHEYYGGSVKEKMPITDCTLLTTSPRIGSRQPTDHRRSTMCPRTNGNKCSRKLMAKASFLVQTTWTEMREGKDDKRTFR